jgi:beta-glucosidase
MPENYNHSPSRYRSYVQSDSTPLYPFGFGLSYARFEYKTLRISPAAMPRDGSAEVSVDITNTGSVSADEVAELYIHALASLPVRPVEELKDFSRLTLRPGETRTVKFVLTPEKLQAYDLDMRRTVQRGAYEVLVGGSSADVLKARLDIN